MLSLASGSATDVGCVRTNNEDDAFTSNSLFVVADGMGGHASGEVASRVAITCLSQLADRADLTPEDIVAAIHSANSEILTIASANADSHGMGTTVTGLGVVRVGGADHWAVFNIGDSRVYRYADDVLSQVTVDHSEVDELVTSGLLTPEDARSHPHRNVVTRSLGTRPAPVADLWVFPPAADERFMLCSDGLNSEVDDEGIAAVLRHHPDPQAAADALVAAALDAGGHDNVTAVVVNLLVSGGSSDAFGDTAPRSVLRGDAD
jgi:protein phosphatase